MKKKVLKEPTLVLMAGLPGVGKTTLASKLGQLVELVILEKDTLKDALLEDEALKEKVGEEIAGRAAYENFFKLAEEFLLNQHLSVILDSSALHPFILERAEELARRARAKLKIIFCHVDESIRQDRLRNRKARISQSHADRIIEEDAKRFAKLPEEHTLKIYTKEGSLEVYAKTALKYIAGQEPAEGQRTSTTSRSSLKYISSLFDQVRHLATVVTREYSTKCI